MQHADREHATWSASSAKRNMACAGALALTMNLPETTSEAADWGTCAHQIAERCLRDDGDADRFIGTTEKGKKYSFEVDEEMADCAQTYVDYVRKAADDTKGWMGDACPRCKGSSYDPDSDIGQGCRACGGTGERYVSVKMWIEQRFSLADLNPPFDAGGTGDAVIYLPAEKRLEVVDLKGGRGVVVEAEGNPQGRTYALGAMLANKGLDVEKITFTIVQPRAPHKAGRVRSETFHVADLVEWTADMMAAMRRSREALDSRQAMPEAAWAATYLAPGDHCRDTFCKAAGSCPALRRKVEDAVAIHFSPIDDKPRIANAPDSGSPEERAARLDMLDMIEAWVKEVRAHEHRMAEMGQPAPGYGLVEKVGREKFVSAEAEAAAIAAARAAGIADDKVLNAPKAKTPKQIRDAFKKAKADASALAGLSSQEATGFNLVKLDETIRPAVSPVDQHFTAI